MLNPVSPSHHALATSLVQSASSSDLATLRGVSRAFRDAVDARLFAHILILELDGDVEIRDSQGGRLPGLSWENASASQREAMAKRLSHTRVVDFYDNVDLSKDPLLSTALCHARIARRLRGGDGLQVSSLVDTLQLGYADAQDDGYDSDDDVPSASVTNVPASVKDLTVCVRFDPQHHRLSEAAYTVTPGRVDNLTVVFREEPFSRAPSRCWSRGSCWSPRVLSRHNSPAQQPRWGFLRPLAAQLACVPEETSITLVGIEDVPRPLVGLTADMGVDDARRDFLDAVALHADEGVDIDKTKAITFLSMEEYRASVGNEAYTLAVTPPGPAPSPPETPDPSDDEDETEQRMSKSQRHEWEKLVRTAARTLIRGCLLY